MRARVPLGEYVTEYSVRNRNNENIPVYSVTNTQGFCTEYFGKEVASKDKSTYKIVPKGYFAYNPSRINVGSVDWQRNEERVIVSPLYHVFSVSDELEKQFLYYFLRSDIGRQMIRAKAIGSVRDNLSLEMLKAMTVPKLTLKEQRACVAVLDRLQKIIALRKRQIAELDTLVKARFVDLFGDVPKTSYVTVKDVCSIITDGTHQPPQFVNKGIPFIFVSNLADNEVTYDAEKFITEETYEELIKRTPIEIGDVLLTTVGSYGHPAVVKTDKKFLFQRHIAYLKPRRDCVNSEFLRGTLLAEDGQRQIEERVKGIAQKTLNLSEIKTISIPLPPLALQNQFADFVCETETARAAVRRGLAEAERLFGSLMQEYFST